MTKGEMATLLEDTTSSHREVKLNQVFNKISGLMQQPVSPTKGIPCGVIESILPSNSGGGLDEGAVEDLGAVEAALARRLESELRAAKTAQLACGEVMFPTDLLPRISSDVIRLAENEPCGLRGCTLYINFETDTECRRIGTVKCDANTVSTFELFLTLKQAKYTWSSIIPHFIKNLTRGGTIMISPGFKLEKKKLYRSYMD